MQQRPHQCYIPILLIVCISFGVGNCCVFAVRVFGDTLEQICE